MRATHCGNTRRSGEKRARHRGRHPSTELVHTCFCQWPSEVTALLVHLQVRLCVHHLFRDENLEEEEHTGTTSVKSVLNFVMHQADVRRIIL